MSTRLPVRVLFEVADDFHREPTRVCGADSPSSHSRADGRGSPREPESHVAPALSTTEGGLPEMRGKLVPALVAATALLLPPAAAAQTEESRAASSVRSLDGSGNNLAHPDLGSGGHAVPAGRRGAITLTGS